MITRERKVVSACFSIGVMLIVFGGGYLYRDFTKREGAWAELQFGQYGHTAAERASVLGNWQDDTLGTKAFAAMALGAGLSAYGLLGLLALRSKNAKPS